MIKDFYLKNEYKIIFPIFGKFNYIHRVHYRKEKLICYSFKIVVEQKNEIMKIIKLLWKL